MFMDDDQILAKLSKVFSDVFDEEINLSRSTTASDIEEWDSLNQIKIILACEKEFVVRLNARDINSLDNIGAMIDHLKKLLGNK